jgi:aryl-alcohol dehydrogenase-like predicted oxidoreductase
MIEPFRTQHINRYRLPGDVRDRRDDAGGPPDSHREHIARVQYRRLGSTGIQVSALAFGAGPVSSLMTGSDADAQLAVVRRALEAGVNWFDTAPSYGLGRSEINLGTALRRLGVAGTDVAHVATKVRLLPEQLGQIDHTVRASVCQSLERIGLARVTLLQLHNSVTACRGDEPTSITPADVLGPGGVLEGFARMRDAGTVEHFGLTGIGQPEALEEVVRSGLFQTMQVPYHLLNPSAGQLMPSSFREINYGNVIAACAAQGMGVFAIRVLAGGALAGQEPSAHTLKTPFFPLDLYQRDLRRAEQVVQHALPPGLGLKEAAVRFALSHPAVTAALIGFGAPGHVDEALTWLDAGPLPPDVMHRLANAAGIWTDAVQ